MSTVTIREATPADNCGLLALTRATLMDGPIQLRIDRDPDFFGLVRLRGSGGKTLIAVVGGRIVACFSITYRTVFINRHPRSVGYMGDLKLDPSHRGDRVLFRILRAALEYIDTQEVGIYTCVIAGGNERAASVLKSRLFLRDWQYWRSAGGFRVYQMLPAIWGAREHSDDNYSIGLAEEKELEDVCALCNNFNASYQLAPVLDSAAMQVMDVGSSLPSPCRIFTARKDGVLVATLSALDLAAVKQIYVAGVSTGLGFLLKTLETAQGILPRFAPPQVGAHLRTLHLRNAAHAVGHSGALRALLARIRCLAFRERYTVVSIGMHERDPLRFMVARVPRYSFKSTLMVTAHPGRNVPHDLGLVEDILRGIPSDDFSIA